MLVNSQIRLNNFLCRYILFRELKTNQDQRTKRKNTRILYFFTLPQELHPLFFTNLQRISLIQFNCTHNTIKTHSYTLQNSPKTCAISYCTFTMETPIQCRLTNEIGLYKNKKKICN